MSNIETEVAGIEGKNDGQQIAERAPNNPDDANRPQNKKSKLAFMKGISNYFGSQWSFARFKIPDSDNSSF